MTEVFRDASKDAGYCSKCQKGYAVGPHVCQTELPPSKEKLPDWLRRWYALKGELRFREAADEIERLQRELDGANKTIAHFMGPEGEKYIDRFAAMLSGPVSLEESIRKYSASEPEALRQYAPSTREDDGEFLAGQRRCAATAQRVELTRVDFFRLLSLAERGLRPAQPPRPDAVEALRPFVELYEKVDERYRKRGGNPDAFKDTHPFSDIPAGDLPMGVWRRAQAAFRAATPPATALDYHKLCDALQQAMLHECVPDMQTDDGIDYRFLDLMSDEDATIDTGKRRIEIFAERIADAVLEHLDSPTLTKGAGHG